MNPTTAPEIMKASFVRQLGSEIEYDVKYSRAVPQSDQILVRSIYAPVNPVDTYMQKSGILVQAWPLVPGCDAGGIVESAGANAVSALGKPWKRGDKVWGCSRLGTPGYGTFGEYFLMDAKLTVPVSEGLSLVQAACLGVAAYTASLGVFGGLNVAIPDLKNPPAPKDEWALVFGGASSVGKIAIQIFKIAGYKVIATASPKSFELVKKVGADEVVSYSVPNETLIAEITAKTEKKLHRIFDATGQNLNDSLPIFTIIGGKDNWAANTNDWTPMEESEIYHLNRIMLGPIGQPEATALNAAIESYIPFLYQAVASGKIVPSEHVIPPTTKEGVESVSEVVKYQVSGQGGSNKVVVEMVPPGAYAADELLKGYSSATI